MYRRVGSEGVSSDNSLQWAAVDLPGFSVDRSKYRANVADVRPNRAALDPHVFVAQVGDFPIAQQGDTSCRVIEFEACIPGEVADPAPRFCAEVVHCPTKEPDNFAHTEIRVRPLGAEYKEDWRPKSD